MRNICRYGAHGATYRLVIIFFTHWEFFKAQMIKPISLFSWLYDVEPDQSGIRFFLFRVWTVHHLDVDNIKSVVETHPLLPGAWNAYNFKNRFLGRSFMLEKKHGWFTRRVLITPKDPEAFCAWVKLKNIDIRLPGETVQ